MCHEIQNGAGNPNTGTGWFELRVPADQADYRDCEVQTSQHLIENKNYH